MNLHQLKSFLVVAQHGQIFRAAEELHLSQPALSRQMAALEADIGAPLLERHSRGVSLTRAGEVLRDEATEILARMQSLIGEIRSGEHLMTSVKIGVPPGLPGTWLRERLGGMPENVRVSLIEAPTDEQLTLLKQRQLDIALARRQSEAFPTQLVFRQRMGIVVRLGSELHHVLGDRPSATLYDMEGLRVLAHSRGEIRVQEEILKNAMRSVNVDATWIFRKFGQYSALIADLVEADVALTTEASARRNFPGWEWIPLEGHDASGKDLVVRTWATWNPKPSPEVTAAVELFTQDPTP
ncbi:LysR family transcriptional regulator [Corynebacterium halotolerans]|uniref:Transcriptional regulator n=1 Tax=Corynebacterium halotolerans YIM 70093 = DSM 44683 TaxID=1121362 RepID=M1P1B5_9CORY|nr:LysR family transcriptional regulator [Corynebacterium halotolerans]AGF73580.1 transcriptional regulator [Corynebacterium halotolerans YIM 70093 = DSM 44683]